MRIRIFQRGKISGSRTVDHQIFSTYTFTKCQIFVLRKNSGESISYPFAFGIEGLSNFNIYRRLFSFKKSHKGHGKTNQCTSVSVILIGFLTHLARAAGKFFKCICLFLLGFRNVLARAAGKFHSYQTR